MNENDSSGGTDSENREHQETNNEQHHAQDQTEPTIPTPSITITLTPEQLERMKRNREQALERRKHRMLQRQMEEQQQSISNQGKELESQEHQHEPNTHNETVDSDQIEPPNKQQKIAL